MKTANGTKLIVLHPPSYTQYHRLFFLFFISFFTFALFLSLTPSKDLSLSSSATTTHNNDLPKPISEALLHYTISDNNTHMTSMELNIVASVLRSYQFSSNFLIFGLTHETHLWKALNFKGRTIFIDENEYLVKKFEDIDSQIEAYDVQYTTKVSQTAELMSYGKEEYKNECRPFQNLLFSECKIGLTDLPNHIYDINWDVILIDGPKGYSGHTPGRLSAIFTAGVFARSKKMKNVKTHVLVHEINRDLERECSSEYLCDQNLVETTDNLGHFVVGTGDAKTFEFCNSDFLPSSSSLSSSMISDIK
ncbi:Polysaccharide biosynthesis domain [Dillenia turbinata]|uniref:Polysaccharide biosynthesis domain n=1 Tax=Dillenia turbinata TaxID=194707 RepID=A0AAN8WGH0_9MAGN